MITRVATYAADLTSSRPTPGSASSSWPWAKASTTSTAAGSSWSTVCSASPPTAASTVRTGDQRAVGAPRRTGSGWTSTTPAGRAPRHGRRPGPRLARRHPRRAGRPAGLGARPRLTAACLDLGLRRAPSPPSCSASTSPLYLSTHSPPARWPPRARPSCTSCATARAPPRPTRRELWGLAATAGITEADVVTDRFLHRMVVAHALPAPGHGLAGRPPVAVARHPGVSVAGDWVGPVGHAGRRQPGQRRVGRARRRRPRGRDGRPDGRGQAGRELGRTRAATTFAVERPRLLGLAYRMTGSLPDAEDVVQDAWLRWSTADQPRIENPAAWLTTVTTRLSLDRIRAAERRRADYVGEWLPEPVATSRGPEETAELAESLTLGFLVLLDRLTPLERAVFLLADVFGEPYRAISETVDKSEAACRQIASRARHKLHDEPGDRARHAGRGSRAARPAGHRGAGRRRRPAARSARPRRRARLRRRTRPARRPPPVVGADRVARLVMNIAAPGDRPRRLDRRGQRPPLAGAGSPRRVGWCRRSISAAVASAPSGSCSTRRSCTASTTSLRPACAEPVAGRARVAARGASAVRALELIDERHRRPVGGQRAELAHLAAAGRPAPGCGPAPGRAGRCRPRGRSPRRRCRRRCPRPTSTRAERAAVGPRTVRPPWFSKPVSTRGTRGRRRCRGRGATNVSPTARCAEPIGLDVEQPDARLVRPPSPRRSRHPGSARPRTRPAPARRARRPGPRPPAARRVGQQGPLGRVLAAAQHQHGHRVGDVAAGREGDDLGRDAASDQPLGQHERRCRRRRRCRAGRDGPARCRSMPAGRRIGADQLAPDLLEGAVVGDQVDRPRRRGPSATSRSTAASRSATWATSRPA